MFRVGSRVVMSEDALANYGRQYEGRVFRVSHVATKYMPAEEFFARGRPSGYHPGFNEGSGDALYDLDGLNSSLYGWELEPAQVRRNPRNTGAGGWPLVPSKAFPGEYTLSCPKCKTTNITMTCRYPVYGTGPGGRGRLGDHGTRDVNRCNECGYEMEF